MLKVLADGLPEEPHPRRGACSAVYEGGFYMWHGSWKSEDVYEYEVDQNPFTLHRLDLETLKWGKRLLKNVGGEIPYHVHTCASYTQYHNFVFTFGGHLTDSFWGSGFDPFCSSLYKVDLEKLEVSLLPSCGQVPCKRDKTSLFYYSDALYLFGGWSREYPVIQPNSKFHCHPKSKSIGWDNEFYCYDLATREWRYQDLKGEYPPPTAASDFARVGDKVYLVAGRQAPARVDDVYILDLPTMEWRHFSKPVPPSTPVPWPAPRSSHVVCPIFMTGDNQSPHLALFGGLSPEDTAYNDVWLLDLSSLRWEQQTRSISDECQINIPGRTWFGMGAVLNVWTCCFEICLFGGMPGSLENTNKVEMSHTVVLELGISSLKRLACFEVVANLARLETQLSYLPPLCVDNLRQRHAAVSSGLMHRVLSRLSPFKPCPDFSHLSSVQ